MRVVYAAGVDDEIAEIVAYLNDEHPRRGDRFRATLAEVVRSVADWPYLVQAMPDTLNARRAVIHRRHLMLYKVYEETQTILVVAVVAGKRDPKEITKRVL